MVTTLSAENCKTKERLIRSRKKVFSRKKSQSLIFWQKNKTYIFNIQNFTTNETSLKRKGEVSSKYHKLGRSIMISCLHRKKNAL